MTFHLYEIQGSDLHGARPPITHSLSTCDLFHTHKYNHTITLQVNSGLSKPRETHSNAVNAWSACSHKHLSGTPDMGVSYRAARDLQMTNL